MKSKIHWCSRTLFLSPIYFALCLSKKAFKHELKRLAIKPQDQPYFVKPGFHGCCHFFTETDNNGYCAIICIDPDNDRPLIEYIGLITHEVMHLWQEIKIHIGEKHPSDEFEAYAVQHLIQQITHAFLESKHGKACISREYTENNPKKDHD